MKKRQWKVFVMFTMSLLIMVSLCGCKPSKKKVEQSQYYKELNAKYKKLKKENEKLQKENDNQEKASDAEKRADKFLAKIARDNLIRVEVGYPDAMEDCYYIEEKGSYGAAIDMAKCADRTTKYTPDQLKKQYDVKYRYVLYDENNAIYEVDIYGNNYMVFTDLPNYVYYAPNATVLGDAFLKNKITQPGSNLLHRLSESPLIIDDKDCYYSNSVAVSIANCIDQMSKKESSREKAQKEWKKEAKTDSDSPEDYEPESVVYSFYSHGKTMGITLYDHYISILNVDENRTWYKVTKTDIKNLKTILQDDQKKRGIDDKKVEPKSADSDEKDNNSHSKQIEDESVISGEEE